MVNVSNGVKQAVKYAGIAVFSNLAAQGAVGQVNLVSTVYTAAIAGGLAFFLHLPSWNGGSKPSLNSTPPSPGG
jgi:hypothetical protein